MKFKSAFFQKYGIALALPALLASVWTPKTNAAEAELGRGLISTEGSTTLLDQCVEQKETDLTSQSVRSTQFELNLLNTKEELIDKMRSSVAVSGSYGAVSAGAKEKFAREVYWNHNSNYILVRATRVTSKNVFAAQSTRLTPYAKRILTDSRFAFREACGTGFITTVEMGGEIYGLIEIESQTFTDKQSVERSLRANGGFTSGSVKGQVEFLRTVQKLSSRFQTKINFQRTGGAQIQIPDSIEELLELGQSIEKLADKNPVSINFLTRDYSSVSNFSMSENDPAVAVRQNWLDWAEQKLKIARDLYSRTHYVLENPEDFKRFDEDTLTQQLRELDELMIKLKNLIAEGTSFLNDIQPQEIEFPNLIKLPEMTWRASRRPLNLSCETKESLACGVESYRSANSASCGVEDLVEGSGPVCGAVYKKLESSVCGPRAFRKDRQPVCGVERYKKCYYGKQQGIFGKRKHGRDKSCGVELYQECRNENFGVESYNSCRHPNHGIEKYNTCKNREFGYVFRSCKHFSHGPERYKTCEVATIGSVETSCPKF